jgi:hypothetical protein
MGSEGALLLTPSRRDLRASSSSSNSASLSMNPLVIPRATSVLLGRAAKPIPRALSDSISDMVRTIPGIREAYLPQCYAKGLVEPPAQVLVLVLEDASDQKVLNAVGQGLARILPPGQHLDVWPMTYGHGLLETVRATRTHVHCTPPPAPKRWWRIPAGLFVLWFLWRLGQILFAK